MAFSKVILPNLRSLRPKWIRARRLEQKQISSLAAQETDESVSGMI